MDTHPGSHERDFDGHTVTYAYDAVGRLARRTNAAGQTVGYRYDSVGALRR
nr:RHS repeat domain-containing protein [Streptomyces sp. ms191]